MDTGTKFLVLITALVWCLYIFLFSGFHATKKKINRLVWAGFICLIAATILLFIDIVQGS